MKKTLLLSLLFLAIFYEGFSQKYHRIKANLDKEKIDVLFKNGFEADHFHVENGVFMGEVSDADISIFKKQNIRFQYIIKDLEKNLVDVNKAIDKKNAGKNLRTAATPANFALGTYGGFYSFQEMEVILDQMRTLFPNLISAKTSIGTSVEGRPVYMIKISDNPDVDEPESELFLNAVHHAREPMSMSQLIYFMWHVLENYNTDPEIKTLLNSTEMYILPCVNPDGYVYNKTTNPNGGGMWRKNRKNNGNGTFGVDINRNYGFQWGYNNSGSSPTASSDTYRGTSAFSEPETQIVRNFCNTHDFVASMDFHSHGNYCIYPFGYMSTNNNPELALFQQMGAFLTAENGFKHGNATQTVNYTANGAGDDWKYGEQSTKNKIYSFTPEIGASTDGFYPASTRIIPLCESTLQMNRKILKLSSKFAVLTSTAPASITSLSGNIPYSVLNYGLRNPSYTLSISSTSPYVSSLPGNLAINNMTLMQNTAGQLAFSLSPTTPIGSVIDFTITLDNGHSPITKTVSIVYDCGAPTALQSTGITTSTATTSWAAVAGVSGYYISYKTSASSTWSADSLIGSTSFILSSLSPGTSYNWRVRTNICSTYSNSSFTTLLPCTNPTVPVSSNITSSGALLSWQATAGATNYQVEYKLASSSTWIVAASANAAVLYQLNGLTASRLYDWRVRSNCSSGNSTYTSAQFTTALQTITYCASKGSNSSLFWIDYFKLSNVTRTSGNDAGYYNGTASIANISKGVSNTITFSPGYANTKYRVYWRIWIDYNKDGDFLDSGEQIASSNTTGTTNYTANFTIPAAALVGNTRIRISMKYNAYATSCETFSYGEVEDYTVNISATSGTVESIANAKVNQSEVSAEPTSETINVKIHPNPTTDELYIDFKQTSTKDLKLKVVDISGKPFFEQILEEDQNGMGIDVSKYTPAVYFLILEKGQQRKSMKFIKK